MTDGRTTADPDALREEIVKIRAELGQTVQALTARADVRAQVEDRINRAKDEMRRNAMRLLRRPVTWMVALGATAGIAVVVVLKLRLQAMWLRPDRRRPNRRRR